MKNSEQSREGVQMPSISDWISFLSSEKHANTSNVISFGSFMLAAGIAIFAVRTTAANDWPTVIVSILAGVVLVTIYLRTIFPFRHRTQVAKDLLEDIMRGKERDVSKIEDEWKRKVPVGKKQKSKKE